MYSLTHVDIYNYVGAYVKSELSGREVYMYQTGKTIKAFYVFKGGAIFITTKHGITSTSGFVASSIELHVVGTTTAHLQMGEEKFNTAV